MCVSNLPGGEADWTRTESWRRQKSGRSPLTAGLEPQSGWEEGNAQGCEERCGAVARGRHV